MILRTKYGARSSLFVGPHPSEPKGEIVHSDAEQGGNDEINACLARGPSIRPKPMVDTTKCEHCERVVRSKLVRATPCKGILCSQCLDFLGNKCFIKA